MLRVLSTNAQRKRCPSPALAFGCVIASGGGGSANGRGAVRGSGSRPDSGVSNDAEIASAGASNTCSVAAACPKHSRAQHWFCAGERPRLLASSYQSLEGTDDRRLFLVLSRAFRVLRGAA